MGWFSRIFGQAPVHPDVVLSPDVKRYDTGAKATSFMPDIPEGFQIYETAEVAGITFRKDDALGFVGGSGHRLELERDPGNRHDPNAIKVIGINNRGGFFVGFVPKEVSLKVVGTGMFGDIRPRLARIYEGTDGYLEIRFQILGPVGRKTEYETFKRPRKTRKIATERAS